MIPLLQPLLELSAILNLVTTLVEVLDDSQSMLAAV